MARILHPRNTTPVFTESIDGRPFDIFLKDNGDFYAVFDEELIEASSKKALHEKLRKLVRMRGRVAVPVTQIETDYDGKLTVRQLTLTGLHGRTRSALYTDDKTGESGQLHYNNVYRRLSGEEIAAAVELYRTFKRAERAWEQWCEAELIDPQTALREAQEQVLNAAHVTTGEESSTNG